LGGTGELRELRELRELGELGELGKLGKPVKTFRWTIKKIKLELIRAVLPHPLTLSPSSFTWRH